VLLVALGGGGGTSLLVKQYIIMIIAEHIGECLLAHESITQQFYCSRRTRIHAVVTSQAVAVHGSYGICSAADNC
jgi:hypothetical protein